LIGWLQERGHRIDAVVSLQVPDALVVERISGRRSCMACGATYHVVTAPPVKEGICDRCGGAVAQRKDDAEAIVIDRLAVYASQTAAALPLLRERATVHDLDGVGTVDEVRRRIFSALGID
jgi:adenylate kinase